MTEHRVAVQRSVPSADQIVQPAVIAVANVEIGCLLRTDRLANGRCRKSKA